MTRSVLTVLVAGALLTGPRSSLAQSADAPVSFESLLKEMIDRDRLARVPHPFYLCRQASSYDRDSVAPDRPGWFANWDRSQFVRIEERDGRKEYVLMDADGPGVIVRFWATWHGPRGGPFSNGTLRVYLDHEPEPAIEGPIADVIDRGALAGPPLSEGVSPRTPYERRGHNLYLPIPYAAHCKITYQTDVPIDRGAKKGEALYYQINYRTYEPGTKVESFHLDQLKRARSVLERTQKRLVESGWAETTGFERTNLAGPVAPGESRSVELEGPRSIRQLTIQIKAADPGQALRSTVLEIHFDGERTVWCPMGAFFGIDYQGHPVRTWTTEVTDDGTMKCFWVMPFERSCRLVVHNLGQQPVEITKGTICHTSWAWDDRSMHFHATWRQLTKVSTRGRKRMTGLGAFDVNYVEVKGTGVYVGDTLSVFNGTNAWWGEGDEK
ncbi:MAG TPA: DUF2961 domain-containing protein, partial [Planctomycetaceae bacterium]|nr:DUF2961 domain-containing protein [Planctomycetaceae bacterium]